MLLESIGRIIIMNRENFEEKKEGIRIKICSISHQVETWKRSKMGDLYYGKKRLELAERVKLIENCFSYWSLNTKSNNKVSYAEDWNALFAWEESLISINSELSNLIEEELSCELEESEPEWKFYSD